MLKLVEHAGHFLVLVTARDPRKNTPEVPAHAAKLGLSRAELPDNGVQLLREIV